MHDSSWSERVSLSSYHFDKTQSDPRWDTVIGLGRFAGDWSHELKEAIEGSQPTTWATRGRSAPKPADLIKEENDLEQQGYGKEYVVTNLNWHIAPIFQRMADFFALKDAMVRVHVQHPGQVWNLHIDKLEKWAPDDPGSVLRVFIALNDWEMGHFWNYGNYQHSGWRAGDVTTFDWQNVPHSTANAGHVPRVTLQVTGVTTNETLINLHKLRKCHAYEI